MKPNEERTQAVKSTSCTSNQMHLSDNFSAEHEHVNVMGQIVS